MRKRADGMEHSSAAFCVLLVSAVERTRSRRPPKRFMPDDARARTVRLPVQNPNVAPFVPAGFESNAAHHRPGSERRFDRVQFENRQIGTLGRRKPALGQDFLKLIT